MQKAYKLNKLNNKAETLLFIKKKNLMFQIYLFLIVKIF